MGDLLPIFPLSLVVFPGMVLPLHIFEERYRALVRQLLDQPDPAQRLFGIVAIREGYEVGSHEAHSMYRVGCVVQLTAAEEYDDGRFDITVVGRHRLKVMGTDTGKAFLRADVEHLIAADDDALDTARETARTLAVFEDYRRRVDRLRGDPLVVGPLPRDAELLSYTLAAACSLTLRQRQQLLESPTTVERLGLLRRTLRAEIGAIRAVPSLPASEVARTGWNPN